MRNRTCLWALAGSFAAVGCGSPGEPPSSVRSAAPSVSTLSLKSAASTKSPIQHAIVIIGENRSFDHLFATY
ncbi:MAG: phospholipase, partial [Polyangiaceae bacterium]